LLAEFGLAARYGIFLQNIPFGGFIQLLIHRIEIRPGFLRVFLLNRGKKFLYRLFKVGLNIKITHVSYMILAQFFYSGSSLGHNRSPFR